jgi:hypothetical protein
MNATKNSACALVAVTAGWVTVLDPAHAQETGKVMIDVADCIKLEAPEARLACYESRVAAVFGERAAQAAAARPGAPAPAAPTPAVAAAIQTPEPAPVPVAPSAPAATSPPAPRTVSIAPAPAPAVTEPVQSRDYRKTRREEDERAAAADAAANDIVSRVKELHETVPNAWQITLENGQVWRQTVSKHYELRPGAQVRIYSTRWGSASRLSSDTINGYIQVERVR